MSKFSLDVLERRVFPFVETDDPDVILGAAFGEVFLGGLVAWIIVLIVAWLIISARHGTGFFGAIAVTIIALILYIIVAILLTILLGVTLIILPF